MEQGGSSVPVPEKYGSKEMRAIFEEENVLRLQLSVEAAVAEAQAELGLIPKEAAKEISAKATPDYVTIERWREIEAITKHETASLVEAIVEVCDEGAKPWVHYGLTSNDVLDTALSLQLKASLEIIERRMMDLARVLSKKAQQYQALPAVGRTHGQQASIIPFGLKFAVWASETVRHLVRLRQMKERALVCKTLGVVGTGSVMREKALMVQSLVAKKLGLASLNEVTQVVPRDLLAEVIFLSALVASTMDKMGTEVRNLQRTEIREAEEPFGEEQIGSSALPIKRNPIRCERVSSLAKFLRTLPHVALENVPLWHERDLSNSANERVTVPSAMILLDETIRTMEEVLEGLVVREDRIRSNLELMKGQIYSEFVLDALIRRGVSRSKAHRLLRKAAFRASEKGASYAEVILEDEELGTLLTKEEVMALFDPAKAFGAAKEIITNTALLVERICGQKRES